MRIAVNCDLGESFGRWTLGADARMMQYVSAANVACGFHAGDASVIAETVRLAVAKGIGVGAHPSYPDRQGFGRRFIHLSPKEISDMVTYQIGAVEAFVRTCGGRLEHVKPHGALYNRATHDGETARAIIEGVRRVDENVVIVVAAATCFEHAAAKMGVRYAREVLADRGYGDNGRALPRTDPAAVITDADEVARRVWNVVNEGRLQTVTGRSLSVAADTVCIHGDTAGAVHIARRVRDVLRARGVRLVTIDAMARP